MLNREDVAMGYSVNANKIRKLRRLCQHVENWPRTLLDHLKITKKEYICKMKNGLKLRVRGGSDDRHIVFEVLVQGIYPVKIASGDVVVDVGAQIGCFAIWAAHQGAHVFAFEPFPENFKVLKANVAMNGLKNVEALPYAVAATSGTRRMLLPTDPSHSGRYSLYRGTADQAVDVASISLDDFLREHELDHVDLVKLDCQGSEYEIVYGLRADTLAKIRCLVVECERFDQPEAWSVEALGRFLSERGFGVHIDGGICLARRG